MKKTLFSTFFFLLLCGEGFCQSTDTCRTAFWLINGAKYVGMISDSTEKEFVLLTKRGKQLSVPKELVKRRKDNCKNRLLASPFSRGWRQQISIGILPSLQPLFEGDFFYSFPFQPTYSIHHAVYWANRNGRALALTLGMERFKNENYWGWETRQSELFAYPIMIGFQKFGQKQKKTNPFFGVNIGMALFSNPYKVTGDFFPATTVKMEQFRPSLQLHAGLMRYINQNQAIAFEIGWRHQQIAIFERYDFSATETVMRYGYNRVSLRFGFMFK